MKVQYCKAVIYIQKRNKWLIIMHKQPQPILTHTSKTGPAYTYEYNQQKHPYMYSPKRNSYNNSNNNTNKLSQLNQRLSQQIQQMKKRNQWKRERQFMKASWGSADRGKGSRISNRSWDRKGQRHRYSGLRYQTDTQSLTSSRASAQFLNRPVITHTSSTKYPQQFRPSPTFHQPYSNNIQQIYKKPILQYNPHREDNQNKNYEKAKIEEGKRYEDNVQKYGNFNKGNHHYEHNDNHVPYFRTDDGIGGQKSVSFNGYRPGEQLNNINNSPSYPKQQSFEQFQDVDVRKRQSLESIPSRDFQDFDDASPSPYSPMALILPNNNNKRSSQKLAPVEISSNKAYKGNKVEQNKNKINEKKVSLLNKVSGMIGESNKSYDGKIFIYCLVGVGVLLVLYQLIR